MATLTVFTLTYNRAYCLHKCYESLLRQSCKDFEWLIVDDGSTDNTKQIVDQWISQALIPIKYIYKENGGMHTGYNVAYDNIFTELAVAIDSDDYMTDDAVEKIVTFWSENKEEKYAGMICLDITQDGKTIGTELPHVKSATVYDLYNRMGVKGDKKEVYRPELIRPFRSPEFNGETLFPTCYKYFLVDLTHEVLILNEPVVVVEYMPDGYTKNIIKSYKKNLNNYIFYREFIMKYPRATFWHRFRFTIHYVAECMLAKRKKFISKSPRPFLTILALPFGVALYFYIQKNG
ncbi:MAG: glycosyltransferase family 2 protein [Oscillospiraceae bacterium]|nr:glycosyltransferase family 2 protein [Oscillospiraceae bacterium]